VLRLMWRPSLKTNESSVTALAFYGWITSRFLPYRLGHAENRSADK